MPTLEERENDELKERISTLLAERDALRSEKEYCASLMAIARAAKKYDELDEICYLVAETKECSNPVRYYQARSGARVALFHAIAVHEQKYGPIGGE